MRARAFAVLALLIACGPRHEEPTPAESAEPCDPGYVNDEWMIDCSTACTHVIACKRTSSDSNIQELTCSDCIGSCIAGVGLGGNDVVEGTEEDRRSWECAELVTGCSALDHNCDLF